jgi:hypothetical protein
MRTTIEMKDEHRAALLELAARRGEKGFSRVLEEAIDAYLRSVPGVETRRRAVAALRGSLGRRAAERLRKETAALRRSWR